MADTNSLKTDAGSRGPLIMLWIIIALGSWFRLYELGVPAFRADTILLWGLANRPVNLSDILFKWFDVSGAAGQMPMPAFLMKALLAVIPGDPTPFTARLPFALLGIAAIPMAYFAGRFISGPKFGLLLAAFVAVNPFHINFSREAYFYSSLFLGYFIYLRAITGILDSIWRDKAPPRREYLLLGLALFFCGYSQMSGLLMCAVGFLYITVELLRRQKQMPALGVFGKVIAVHAVVFLPFFFVEWGPREMVEQLLEGSQTEYSKQVVALSGANIVTGMTKALSGFSWGTTLPGVLMLVVSLALSVAALRKSFKRYVVFVVVFLVLQVALFAMVRSALGALYESRYLSGLFPFWLVLLAGGWYWLGFIVLPTLVKKCPSALAVAVCAIPIIAWTYPAHLITQLTGNPTPYYDIVSKCDSSLGPGAPVLIDRWFEPWNEMRSHPSTNVNFTFTVPNEPLPTYQQNNWRATAESFLMQNPDAAYLEIAKTYQEVPEVGPWNWPHEYFARHETIVNEAGLKLMQMGLAGRGGYYSSNTNRLVVELFYNTREDFIEKLKDQGVAFYAFYGTGWQYEKSGPMGIFRLKTQTFNDWRIMGAKAALELYNLTDETADVSLRIAALSPSGPKRVMATGGKSFEFNGARMQGWEVGPFRIEPGRHIMELTDILKERAQYPLFVSSIEMKPIK